MIVKTFDLKGNVKYFNAMTGKEVKIQRENPRYQNHIPDYAFGFLSPKIEAVQELQKANAIKMAGTKKRLLRSAAINRGSTTIWQRLKNWFNALFSNGNRN